jgi:hypothetical protein
VGLVLKADSTFAVTNPGIELQESNARWAVPCRSICPATWRKTIGDRGRMAVVWRSSWSLERARSGEDGRAGFDKDIQWGFPGSPTLVTPFMDACWEDDVDALQWKPFKKCSNIWCANHVLDSA